MRGILALLVLASVCGTTLACSCLPYSDEKKYCTADFAFKIKIRRSLKIPGGPNEQTFDSFYRIKIKKIWKFPDGAPLPNKYTDLFTACNSAMCGVTSLQRGVKYLVTGSYNSFNGKLSINSCGSLIRAAPLQSPMKRWKKHPLNCEEPYFCFS